jgi:spermidine synthase
MRPWELLGETRTPEGSDVRLTRQDSEYVILVDGKTLMSSRRHGSEDALAALACPHLRSADAPHVLVGGLGMGFTLRATLDLLPPDATVTMIELLPAVIEWNRGPLGALAGYPLNDRRVRIEVGDVGLALRASRPSRYGAILLDVDNGPAAFTASANGGLYDNAGVSAAHAALGAGGVLAVWSAREDRKFEQRLRFHGFDVRVTRVRARLKRGGPRHVIFLGVKG